MRPQPLQAFLDAAGTAFRVHTKDPLGIASLNRIFAALATPQQASETPPARLPACAHLQAATDPARFEDPALRRLIDAFRALEPALRWRRRDGDCTNASANFADNHANAVIAGPGGLERRSDVMLGVSLVAPHVRYPDHTHPPEETYLVMSPGDFRHGQSGWFTPGIGGTFYNPPDILHAMRSGDAPLFAVWALLPGRHHSHP